MERLSRGRELLLIEQRAKENANEERGHRNNAGSNLRELVENEVHANLVADPATTNREVLSNIPKDATVLQIVDNVKRSKAARKKGRNTEVFMQCECICVFSDHSMQFQPEERIAIQEVEEVHLDDVASHRENLMDSTHLNEDEAEKEINPRKRSRDPSSKIYICFEEPRRTDTHKIFECRLCINKCEIGVRNDRSSPSQLTSHVQHTHEYEYFVLKNGPLEGQYAVCKNALYK
jgi:uncharacterized protein YacL (UPF0231 family)